MTGYLCHLALPAVVKRRLFQFNFVSRGRPLSNIVLFSSSKSCAAYFSRRPCSSAFPCLGILGGGLFIRGVLSKIARGVPACLLSSPDECEWNDPSLQRVIGKEGMDSLTVNIWARRMGLRALRGSFLPGQYMSSKLALVGMASQNKNRTIVCIAFISIKWQEIFRTLSRRFPPHFCGALDEIS